MNILIFLQGTVLMHKGEEDLPRQKVVEQARAGKAKDYKNYIPIGNAAQKLQTWVKQGATISYLSSLTESKLARLDERVSSPLELDKEVLQKYNFPDGQIYHRNKNETYQQVIARMNPLPEIFIEDDCESIGQNEISWPKLSNELKEKIKSLVVLEFSGIDYLPDEPTGLDKLALSPRRNKNHIATLIPYKTIDKQILVYLQKRTADAKKLPDWFGFFGGHFEEGESTEQAFGREIKEELNFVPDDAELFSKDGLYENESRIMHVFIQKVDDDFEKNIEIREGQYGKFFNEQEALNEPRLTAHDRKILRDFFNKFRP